MPFEQAVEDKKREIFKKDDFQFFLLSHQLRAEAYASSWYDVKECYR